MRWGKSNAQGCGVKIRYLLPCKFESKHDMPGVAAEIATECCSCIDCSALVGLKVASTRGCANAVFCQSKVKQSKIRKHGSS